MDEDVYYCSNYDNTVRHKMLNKNNQKNAENLKILKNFNNKDVNIKDFLAYANSDNLSSISLTPSIVSLLSSTFLSFFDQQVNHSQRQKNVQQNAENNVFCVGRQESVCSDYTFLEKRKGISLDSEIINNYCVAFEKNNNLNVSNSTNYTSSVNNISSFENTYTGVNINNHINMFNKHDFYDLKDSIINCDNNSYNICSNNKNINVNDGYNSNYIQYIDNSFTKNYKDVCVGLEKMNQNENKDNFLPYRTQILTIGKNYNSCDNNSCKDAHNKYPSSNTITNFSKIKKDVFNGITVYNNDNNKMNYKESNKINNIDAICKYGDMLINKYYKDGEANNMNNEFICKQIVSSKNNIMKNDKKNSKKLFIKNKTFKKNKEYAKFKNLKSKKKKNRANYDKIGDKMSFISLYSSDVYFMKKKCKRLANNIVKNKRLKNTTYLFSFNKKKIKSNIDNKKKYLNCSDVGTEESVILNILNREDEESFYVLKKEKTYKKLFKKEYGKCCSENLKRDHDEFYNDVDEEKSKKKPWRKICFFWCFHLIWLLTCTSAAVIVFFHFYLPYLFLIFECWRWLFFFSCSILFLCIFWILADILIFIKNRKRREELGNSVIYVFIKCFHPGVSYMLLGIFNLVLFKILFFNVFDDFLHSNEVLIRYFLYIFFKIHILLAALYIGRHMIMGLLILFNAQSRYSEIYSLFFRVQTYYFLNNPKYLKKMCNVCSSSIYTDSQSSSIFYSSLASSFTESVCSYKSFSCNDVNLVDADKSSALFSKIPCCPLLTIYRMKKTDNFKNDKSVNVNFKKKKEDEKKKKNQQKASMGIDKKEKENFKKLYEKYKFEDKKHFTKDDEMQTTHIGSLSFYSEIENNKKSNNIYCNDCCNYNINLEKNNKVNNGEYNYERSKADSINTTLNNINQNNNLCNNIISNFDITAKNNNFQNIFNSNNINNYYNFIKIKSDSNERFYYKDNSNYKKNGFNNKNSCDKKNENINGIVKKSCILGNVNNIGNNYNDNSNAEFSSNPLHKNALLGDNFSNFSYSFSFEFNNSDNGMQYVLNNNSFNYSTIHASTCKDNSCSNKIKSSETKDDEQMHEKKGEKEVCYHEECHDADNSNNYINSEILKNYKKRDKTKQAEIYSKSNKRDKLRQKKQRTHSWKNIIMNGFRKNSNENYFGNNKKCNIFCSNKIVEKDKIKDKIQEYYDHSKKDLFGLENINYFSNINHFSDNVIFVKDKNNDNCFYKKFICFIRNYFKKSGVVLCAMKQNNKLEERSFVFNLNSRNIFQVYKVYNYLLNTHIRICINENLCINLYNFSDVCTIGNLFFTYFKDKLEYLKRHKNQNIHNCEKSCIVIPNKKSDCYNKTDKSNKYNIFISNYNKINNSKKNSNYYFCHNSPIKDFLSNKNNLFYKNSTFKNDQINDFISENVPSTSHKNCFYPNEEIKKNNFSQNTLKKKKIKRNYISSKYDIPVHTPMHTPFYSLIKTPLNTHLDAPVCIAAQTSANTSIDHYNNVNETCKEITKQHISKKLSSLLSWKKKNFCNKSWKEKKKKKKVIKHFGGKSFFDALKHTNNFEVNTYKNFIGNNNSLLKKELQKNNKEKLKFNCTEIFQKQKNNENKNNLIKSIISVKDFFFYLNFEDVQKFIKFIDRTDKGMVDRSQFILSLIKTYFDLKKLKSSAKVTYL